MLIVHEVFSTKQLHHSCSTAYTCTAMPADDAKMDDEEFECSRAQFEQTLAELELRRPVLEARGDDVDAMIAEMKHAWEQYAQAHEAADAAIEHALQCMADQVDAGNELIMLVRQGAARWDEALEQAAGEGSLEQVKVWEGYKAWKQLVRERVQEPSAQSLMPEFQRVIQEVLRLTAD